MNDEAPHNVIFSSLPLLPFS